MPITIKGADEILKMRQACAIVRDCLVLLENMAKPGITTKQMDAAAETFIRSRGAVPSFLGYRKYPASVCISINQEVIHGIPSSRMLQNGDVVSVDVGACLYGFHGDAARTFGIGQISLEHQKLIDVTRESFFKGIEFAKEGCHLYEISAAICDYVEQNGFAVVRDYIGHGVGRALHEEPEIPNYRQRKRGPLLQTGMTLAIEPMVNMGTHEVDVLSDDWTVVTRDGLCSAHYENTVLIHHGNPSA